MKPNIKDSFVTLLCRLLALLFRRRKPPLPHPPRLFSILIVKPCCLGDVLMATPTISSLRHAYPEAKIDFAVGNWSRAMVENNPHLDGILDCGPVFGAGHYGLLAYLGLVKAIKAGNYDCCLVLERSPLITLLPFLARIPVRVGLDSDFRGFSLTLPLPVPLEHHEAELYLDTVRALGIQVEEPQLEFYPTPQDRERASTLLNNSGFGQENLERPLVVIHPGGGRNPGMDFPAKRWPTARFAAFADHLVERLQAFVLLVGGPSDLPFAEDVKKKMRREPLDLTGQTTLGELGAILERSQLFIGNDTGATHLAIAVGTPVVAIFGPSSPANYGPFGPAKGVALWGRADCSPCFLKGRFNESCPDHKCIQAVTIEEAWQAAVQLLNGAKTSAKR